MVEYLFIRGALKPKRKILSSQISCDINFFFLSYLRLQMKQKRSNSLAVLSIKNELINSLHF